MPCHVSYTRFIFGKFSYVLQFDMHFICTLMWTKKFILVKSGCYNVVNCGHSWLLCGPCVSCCQVLSLARCIIDSNLRDVTPLEMSDALIAMFKRRIIQLHIIVMKTI
jgi:hypothetical protein